MAVRYSGCISPSALMLAPLKELADSGLIDVSAYLTDGGDTSPAERKALLKRVTGIMYTSHRRPPALVMFKAVNMPQPSQIITYQGPDTVYADTQMAEDRTLARVLGFVRRRLADNAYVLHLHPTRTFFFVVKDGPRHRLLDSELDKQLEEAVKTEGFPVCLWKTSRLPHTPSYFWHNGRESTFYGANWVITLRLCEDCVPRVVFWKGLKIEPKWRGAAFTVVGTKHRPMMIMQKVTEHGQGCVIRPLVDYSRTC